MSVPSDGQPLPRYFGSYQLFDPIGRGGMAEIFLARTEGALGASKLVVVKVIHEALGAKPDFANQFIDEAKLCAGLRHANIAQVLDLGREPTSNRLFMAMEYVEGFDLQVFLRRLTQAKLGMPPQFAFHIAREVLVALDFAHRAQAADGSRLGIVHRDVSPSNVLLSFEGEVKLCDFGIAKAFALSTDEDGAPQVVGKSAYMSPEHARGEKLDGRADLFCAGIILWELCAGRRLYRGTEVEMLALARAAEIPPLPDRGLPRPEALQAFFDRALARDADARFADAADMLHALDGYVDEAGLFSSQLRFADFLTENFAHDIIQARREKERAARALARGPAVALTPLADDDGNDATEVAPMPMGLDPAPSSTPSIATAPLQPIPTAAAVAPPVVRPAHASDSRSRKAVLALGLLLAALFAWAALAYFAR